MGDGRHDLAKAFPHPKAEPPLHPLLARATFKGCEIANIPFAVDVEPVMADMVIAAAEVDPYSKAMIFETQFPDRSPPTKSVHVAFEKPTHIANMLTALALTLKSHFERAGVSVAENPVSVIVNGSVRERDVTAARRTGGPHLRGH